MTLAKTTKTTVTVNEETLKTAKELKINVSRAADNGIQEAVTQELKFRKFLKDEKGRAREYQS